MEFGVFDHLDRGDVPLRDYYARRLALIAHYDRAGFYAYHVAEHHATPLGMAPSPSVFLAAAAQQTRRLRLGTLVYALPLHHPLRMIEEICMLDQMSGGRLDIGFGRGSSPIELEYYGQDPETAHEDYEEELATVLRGLTARTSTADAGTCIAEVPMELAPLQSRIRRSGMASIRPRAPSARRGAASTSSATSPPPPRASISTAFARSGVQAQAGGRGRAPIGVTHFIVTADNDAEALASRTARLSRVASRASTISFAAMAGRPRPAAARPISTRCMQAGKGVAGTPDRGLRCSWRDGSARPAPITASTGSRSAICRSRRRQRSVALFASAVMPRLAARMPGAAPNRKTGELTR